MPNAVTTQSETLQLQAAGRKSSADNDNNARLREALRVFLRCGSSYKLAAEALDLHSIR